MHNAQCTIIICLRTTILIELTVRISPKYPKGHSLLVLLVSVYVNLSKNSFFSARQERFLICGCKGTTFFVTTKTFRAFFSIFCHFFERS